jgi:PAS domain S-box-containing protein
LLNEAVVVVAEILYVPYCEVLELLPDGTALLLGAGVGFKPERVGVATVGAGTDSQAGYTLLSKEPVIVEDFRTEARFSGPPLLRELGVVSGMSVVIPGLDRPYGVLGAHSNRPQTFTQDDVRFLQAVAHVLSGAIQRLRMEDALGRIAAAVSATTGETFFRSLVQCLAETLQVDYAFIGELDEERPDRVRMTAVCAHGQLGENNRVYELAGTPCEEVVNKRLCSYASGVQALFPRDRLLVEMGVDSYLGTPLFDSTGRALGLIVVLHSRPMRNPQQAESMLQICAVRAAAELQRLRSEELLRKQSAAMEASMDGMALLDEQERYIYVNEAHARIYGSDRPQELIGQSWTILYDSQELRRFEREVMPAMRANGYWRGEAVGRRKDGNLYPQEVSLTALANGGLIYVVRDITDRKKLEEELRQAQKMEAVGQLAGGVAHDFNNLLTAILGYCEFLRGPLDRDAFADYVAEIAKAGTRAASLTQQLLAFSRRQVLQPKVLSLNTVVADTAAMLRRLIGEHITLVTRLSPELELVKADPFQLQQVILNLAINARDAMPQGGWLTIETSNVEMDGVEARHAGMLAGSYVRLAVSDTGHGMDRETMSHIFEPFFTTKEMGKGTGLGLATVYGIVKQSEGFIEAQSQPERGATFSIYLPRLCQPVEAGADKPMPGAAVRGQETILVVEDADLVRSLTCRILQTRGYAVLEARDGIEAIEVWRAHRDKVHLLLTDAIMPFMSGRELAERLSAERPAVRILYMSGYTDDAGLHEGASHEGTAFLQKPFAPEALLEKVRAVLDAP